jgi:carboxyl-terminal processing protease
MTYSRKKKRLSSLVLGLLMSSCAFSISAAEDEELPLEQLQTFAEIYNLIKSTYVDDVDDDVLIKGAIIGMLDSLDPHSTFLNKEDYKGLMESSTGQYGGLGIEVIPDDNAIKIITPIDDSPAKRAGILPGDMIVRINNTPLRNIKSEDALNLMRGKLGDSVHLTIRRKGEAELLEFDLIREIIKFSSVNSRWLGNGLAYIRIAQFQRRTANDLNNAIDKLNTLHNQQIKGLVLDLRNNPGGVLGTAKSVADTFLDDGIIFSTKGNVATANNQFTAEDGDRLNGAPIVILINGGSASAAEIVAGALQDQKRAIIMGTQSFGKGSVQTLMPVSDDSALKLTTARYFTPNGRSIQGIGITPDIEVHQAELIQTEKQGNQVQESDLKGALKNTALEKSEEEQEKQKQIQLLLANDFQLSEAVNLLRGINILSLK